LARPLQAESEYHAISWAFDFGGVLHRPFHRPSCRTLATRDSTIVAENPIWLRPLLAISNAPVAVLSTDGMEAPSEPIENFWVVSVMGMLRQLSSHRRFGTILARETNSKFSHSLRRLRGLSSLVNSWARPSAIATPSSRRTHQGRAREKIRTLIQRSAAKAGTLQGESIRWIAQTMKSQGRAVTMRLTCQRLWPHQPPVRRRRFRSSVVCLGAESTFGSNSSAI
jgi:hypothetical protein